MTTQATSSAGQGESTGAETLTVTDNRTGQVYELPIADGTIRATDLRQIRVDDDDFGLMTYDPAFMNTASCRSAVTFLDGERGVLEYRGYPIEQLAEKSTFLEVAYLLVYGDLPTQAQLDAWVGQIADHSGVDENFRRLLEGFRYDAHPMGMLQSAVGALSTYYPEAKDVGDPDVRMEQVIRLIGTVPTLGAWAFRHNQGWPLVYPDASLDYPSNVINMFFNKGGAFEIDPRLARAMDVLLILHADHEQNCSTSAVRSVGSSQADPYSAVAAGVSALYGPLHGGANEAVLRMLKRIKDPKDIPAFAVTGVNPLLSIAVELEKIALEDEYFVKRKLYPNVDFYSGLIYEALNIPVEMFTVMFAIGRTPGWVAQWLEMIQDKEQKISRPRQVYVGARQRDYTEIGARSS